MKTLAYVLIGFVSIFCLTGLYLQNVYASDYLGDFCWQAKGGEVILKLGVSHIGGGHYIVSGKLDEGTLRGPVHGNAEIEGENVYVTLVGTEKDDDEISNQIYHIILNINTLNGTVESIEHQYNYYEVPAFETEYNEPDTLTFISCP